MSPELKLISQAMTELKKIQLVTKEYMTVEECAKYLGLSRSAIYKLTHRKEIPHFKPSKRVMFKRSEVDAWIQKSYAPTK
ncbi:helix-turn-helix domain-containing protein [Idiomarina sp. HP20-50]|uniref:helix-turn-helix domain-containing protein n=1 Tax=Idiomarina sp. HP20-50 TaxID=3070813 RepID=UPI00294B2585|nr:helix-turn-helix domain-containing protein [Idiomarina sp. HP20-50]MDV6316685.1 helix-turn-helix domain-containing protein [Idiomarina sp. HP20-50]